MCDLLAIVLAAFFAFDNTILHHLASIALADRNKPCRMFHLLVAVRGSQSPCVNEIKFKSPILSWPAGRLACSANPVHLGETQTWIGVSNMSKK